MTDTDKELIERLRRESSRQDILDCELSLQAADRIEALSAENARLREVLIEIDALDPEHLIDSCAQTAMRGLVLRMGEIARAALQGGDDA